MVARPRYGLGDSSRASSRSEWAGLSFAARWYLAGTGAPRRGSYLRLAARRRDDQRRALPHGWRRRWGADDRCAPSRLARRAAAILAGQLDAASPLWQRGLRGLV